MVIVLLTASNTILCAQDDILDEVCSATPNSLCDPPYIICKSGTCQHKDVFSMEIKEFFGYLVVFGIAMLAVASGIGGGNLFVPILIIFFDLSTKEAVALSNGMIFFNSLTKFLMTWKEKHSLYKWKPQIDYNIAIVFNPMMLFGAYIGVIVNTVLPDLIILITLVMTIVAAASVSLTKGVALFKKETKQIAEDKAKREEELAKEAKKSSLVKKAEKVVKENTLYHFVDGLAQPVSPVGARKMSEAVEHVQWIIDQMPDSPEESNNSVEEVEENADVPFPNDAHFVKPISPNLSGDTQDSPKNVDLITQQESPDKALKLHAMSSNSNSEDDESPEKINKENNQNAEKESETPATAEPKPVAIIPRNDAEIEAIKLVESRPIPWGKFSLIWLIFAVTIVTMLLQGAKGADSVAGIKKCSGLDWSVFAIFGILALVFSFVGGMISRREDTRKVKAGWEFDKFEKRWTASRLISANICAPVVGMLAATFGLGGGTMLNPMLLSFGFQPMTISSTAMFLIMVSKLAASILFVLSGKMPMGYWFFLGAFLVVATVIAQIQLKSVVKRLGRQSIIAFVFVFLMAISIVLIIVVGSLKTVENLKDGKNIWQFTGYCAAE